MHETYALARLVAETQFKDLPDALLAGLFFDPVNSLLDVSEDGSKAAAVLAHGFAEFLWVN